LTSDNLSPYIRTQLSDLAHLDALKEEIRNRSWGSPIIPRLLISPQGPVIIEPWNPLFDDEIDAQGLSMEILPPGAPFSRIWCDKGVWKPISL